MEPSSIGLILHYFIARIVLISLCSMKINDIVKKSHGLF